jgi:hypothetical protein
MVRRCVLSLWWVLAVLLVACRPAGGTVATHNSPDGRYTVELVGRSTRPETPFTEHVLYANARREGAEVVRDWPIHFAHHLDTAFDEEYAETRWEQGRVLRFVAAAGSSPHGRDVVVVRNASSRSIAFLELKAGDLLIAFDIAQGAALTVDAPPLSRSAGWLSIEGQWTNGRRLPGVGMNVRLDGHQDADFECHVDITDNQVVVREVKQRARPYR